ncbi:hypothetical protein LINPERHAP1_LOCUS15905 [Linum perenne]
MTRRRGSKTLLETRTAKLSDTKNVAILLFTDSSLLRNIKTSGCDLFLSLQQTHSKKRITNRISTTLRIEV